MSSFIYWRQNGFIVFTIIAKILLCKNTVRHSLRDIVTYDMTLRMKSRKQQKTSETFISEIMSLARYTSSEFLSYPSLLDNARLWVGRSEVWHHKKSSRVARVGLPPYPNNRELCCVSYVGFPSWCNHSYRRCNQTLLPQGSETDDDNNITDNRHTPAMISQPAFTIWGLFPHFAAATYVRGTKSVQIAIYIL